MVERKVGVVKDISLGHEIIDDEIRLEKVNLERKGKGGKRKNKEEMKEGVGKGKGKGGCIGKASKRQEDEVERKKRVSREWKKKLQRPPPRSSSSSSTGRFHHADTVKNLKLLVNYYLMPWAADWPAWVGRPQSQICHAGGYHLTGQQASHWLQPGGCRV